MEIMDIVLRALPPRPWSEGEKIPWNEPGFSRRMLKEHLSQEHNAASRRTEIINRHVHWIHSRVLAGKSTRILDLGCGPGLYAVRLARLGHSCRGIDFSPASIEYARAGAEAEGLDCSYLEADIRSAEFGGDYGLIMLIFGEFDVFRPADAVLILEKALEALQPGGILLLEVHTFETVRSAGRKPPGWSSAESGLFSERPHLLLSENFWHAEEQTTTQRYYLVDAASQQVARFAQSIQGRTTEQLQQLLGDAGFEAIECLEQFGDVPDKGEFLVVTGRKPGREAAGAP